MSAQQAINESLPMLDDVLGQIGIHQTGKPLDFPSLKNSFSVWLEQQVVSEQDFAFMVGLVGAFICEYFIEHNGAQRRVVGHQIHIGIPFQIGVVREFDPYAVAAGLIRERKNLGEFLAQAAT